jgi:hypothetical protein
MVGNIPINTTERNGYSVLRHPLVGEGAKWDSETKAQCFIAGNMFPRE